MLCNVGINDYYKILSLVYGRFLECENWKLKLLVFKGF